MTEHDCLNRKQDMQPVLSEHAGMQTHQPEGTERLKQVLLRILLQSRGERQRLKDLMEQYDDPVTIAQFSVSLVEQSAIWGTAFLIMRSMHIKLDNKDYPASEECAYKDEGEA